MPVSRYKPQCEAKRMRTFYYSDFKYPCHKDEVVPEDFGAESEFGEINYVIDFHSVSSKEAKEMERMSKRKKCKEKRAFSKQKKKPCEEPPAYKYTFN